MSRWASVCLSIVALVAAIGSANGVAAENNKPAKPTLKAAKPRAVAAASLDWKTDYADALLSARSAGKMLLIHFYQQGQLKAAEAQDGKLFSNPRVQNKLDRYILARLPLDTTIISGGKKVKVSAHRSFSELQGSAGLAILDYASNKKSETYGDVVSVVRYRPGKYYQFRSDHLPVLLDLPAGTLTQRSMVFAVRIHPEAPASTRGEKNPVLIDEAKSHSRYQAAIRVQGHHRWDTRFQRIIGRLFGRRRAPVEVVAESWPSQDLMDSCVDCVASWRQSPGHWSAVRARQASYGYDIRKGQNGIWYATGIFAN